MASMVLAVLLVPLGLKTLSGTNSANGEGGGSHKLTQKLQRTANIKTGINYLVQTAIQGTLIQGDTPAADAAAIFETASKSETGATTEIFAYPNATTPLFYYQWQLVDASYTQQGATAIKDKLTPYKKRRYVATLTILKENTATATVLQRLQLQLSHALLKDEARVSMQRGVFKNKPKFGVYLGIDTSFGSCLGPKLQPVQPSSIQSTPDAYKVVAFEKGVVTGRIYDDDVAGTFQLSKQELAHKEASGKWQCSPFLAPLDTFAALDLNNEPSHPEYQLYWNNSSDAPITPLNEAYPSSQPLTFGNKLLVKLLGWKDEGGTIEFPMTGSAYPNYTGDSSYPYAESSLDTTGWLTFDWETPLLSLPEPPPGGKPYTLVPRIGSKCDKKLFGVCLTMRYEYNAQRVWTPLMAFSSHPEAPDYLSYLELYRSFGMMLYYQVHRKSDVALDYHFGSYSIKSDSSSELNSQAASSEQRLLAKEQFKELAYLNRAAASTPSTHLVSEGELSSLLGLEQFYGQAQEQAKSNGESEATVVLLLSQTALSSETFKHFFKITVPKKLNGSVPTNTILILPSNSPHAELLDDIAEHNDRFYYHTYANLAELKGVFYDVQEELGISTYDDERTQYTNHINYEEVE